MTLTPETRVTLTDSLRPPSGYRIDVAVGTTYSMNLTALLLAPLSFALFDLSDATDLDADPTTPKIDPIRVLEAVRRYGDHTTVFCQAGAIHVPSAYRSLLTFVEDSVFEVVPPPPAKLFHPKIWALRFVDSDGEHPTHRFVILSRNLSLDRSWDTALVLDEAENGQIDAAPAAKFVQQLPSLCLPGRGPSQQRLEEIDSLARSLEKARLAPPSPFSEGWLVPIGMTDAKVWPFPERGQQVLAISPFLTARAVRRLLPLGRDGQRTLVSRAESFERVGAGNLAGWNDVRVLQKLAEPEAEEDAEEDAADMPASTAETIDPRDGLHAKTFIVDLPGVSGCGHKRSCKCISKTITGSANLTSYPWGGSVEFDAVLVGPTRECGVLAVLKDKSDDAPGLSRLLEPFEPTSQEGRSDATIDTLDEIDAFHQALARADPKLHITQVRDDLVDVLLTIAIPPQAPGKTQLWLASLPENANLRELAAEVSWSIAPGNVTPFLALKTTAGDGDARVTRQRVIKASLVGDVEDRRQLALAQVLNSQNDVLRYLIFLLGDPSYEAMFTQITGAANGSWETTAAGQFASDVTLFEPLVRATGRDDDAVARVASLVEQLRDLPNGADLVPEGFDELWHTVWEAHQELRR
jgi:hypothetical protein